MRAKKPSACRESLLVGIFRPINCCSRFEQEKRHHYHFLRNLFSEQDETHQGEKAYNARRKHAVPQASNKKKMFLSTEREVLIESNIGPNNVTVLTESQRDPLKAPMVFSQYLSF